MNKFYGACKLTQETLDRINDDIRETLETYYRNHDVDSFFKIVGIVELCESQDLTKDEIPALIEMKNVIVMG